MAFPSALIPRVVDALYSALKLSLISATYVTAYERAQNSSKLGIGNGAPTRGSSIPLTTSGARLNAAELAVAFQLDVSSSTRRSVQYGPSPRSAPSSAWALSWRTMFRAPSGSEGDSIAATTRSSSSAVR